jgi:hypothetical protein
MGSKDGIYHDVEGAPFRIGDRVNVVLLADDTADAAFLGRKGRVIYFEYTCGCGQTYPGDPMIGVKFHGKFEEFWKEELALLPKKPAANRKGKNFSAHNRANRVPRPQQWNSTFGAKSCAFASPSV